MIKYNYKFSRNDGKDFAPMILVVGRWSQVGEVEQYNSFTTKKGAKDFILANKTIARRVGLLAEYEQVLKNYKLVCETISYTTEEIP